MSPERAVEAVREAFVAYARGEWTMPPKVYVPAYPAGDFRAMPALGGGYAALKWVTSFPGNPAKGLPTVTGLVLLSSAEDGTARGLLRRGRGDRAADRSRRRARRRDAGPRRCREPPPSSAPASTGGRRRGRFSPAGVRLRSSTSTPAAQSRRRPSSAPDVAGSLEEALSADLVVTMTPGHEPVIVEGTLRPGQHVSLMGADGPGKAEIAVAELARTTSSATTGSRRATTASSHTPSRQACLAATTSPTLGAVLAGTADGRRADDEITAFDSTGLAIQDLAIALAALERAGDLDLPSLDL